MEKLNQALTFIRATTDFVPDIALILGSGLGDIADSVSVVEKFSYDTIPNLVKSTTAFHKGELILGYLDGVKVAVLSGRVHLYEGYSVDEVVRPVRLLYLLGARKLVVTNASGGINLDYNVGDLVVISDHISSFVPSPIRGDIRRSIVNLDFPDMTAVYDKEGGEIFADICKKRGVSVRRGVYIQVSGAQYETPAEIKFYRTIGADLVGMSTVVESMTAKHLGMSIVGISLVTNMASGVLDVTLSHEEVKAVANKKAKDFCLVLKEFLPIYDKK